MKIPPGDTPAIPEAELPKLEPHRRAALIRRGNQFFNEGDVEMARRIFVTASYNPGLQRVGDFYYRQGAWREAYRVYTQASVFEKREHMIQAIARLIARLLR